MSGGGCRSCAAPKSAPQPDARAAAEPPRRNDRFERVAGERSGSRAPVDPEGRDWRVWKAVRPLADCAAELSLRAEEDGRWHIRIEELAEYIGIPETELYSTAYRLGEKVTFSDAVDGFSDETVGELVTLLEELAENDRAGTERRDTPATDVEALFTDAGIFLPHDRRLELMANFLAVVQHEARTHEIDQDTFVAMLLHFKSFEQSFETYVDEYFDLDAAMEKTALFYRRTFELPPAAFYTALHYLELLFVRKILQLRSLFVSLRNELAELAHAAGFIGRGRERYYTYGDTGSGGRREEARDPGGDAVRRALKTMQLRQDELSPSRLKQQYKRLMKRYHPDVNPDGLEMSKRITSSYSVLLQTV